MFVIVFDWSIRILKLKVQAEHDTGLRLWIWTIKRRTLANMLTDIKNTGERFENAKRWRTVLFYLLLLFLRFGDFWWAFFAFFTPFCACWTAFSLWKTLKVIIIRLVSITNYLIFMCFYFIFRLTISAYSRGRMKKGFVLAEARWFLSVTCRTFFRYLSVTCRIYLSHTGHFFRKSNLLPPFQSRTNKQKTVITVLPQKTSSRFDAASRLLSPSGLAEENLRQELIDQAAFYPFPVLQKPASGIDVVGRTFQLLRHYRKNAFHDLI